MTDTNDGSHALFLGSECGMTQKLANILGGLRFGNIQQHNTTVRVTQTTFIKIRVMCKESHVAPPPQKRGNLVVLYSLTNININLEITKPSSLKLSATQFINVFVKQDHAARSSGTRNDWLFSTKASEA